LPSQPILEILLASLSQHGKQLFGHDPLFKVSG